MFVERVHDVAGPFVTKIGHATGSLQVAVEVTDDGGDMLRLLFGDETILEAIGAQVALQDIAPVPSVVQAMAVPTDPDREYRTRVERGRIVLDALVAVNSDHGRYKGLWANLDRTGANRLIKLLRRGRDVAFGRDE